MTSTPQIHEIIPQRPITREILPPRTTGIVVRPPITPQPPQVINQQIELTKKQKKFVEGRLRNMTETAAAKYAGYSDSMCANAWQISANPSVKKEFRRRLLDQYKEEELTTDEIINGWRRVVDANILDFVEIKPDGGFNVNLSGVTRAQADVIEELSMDAYGRPKVKLAAKQPAREMLARYKKLFSDSDQAKGSDELTIGKLDELVRNFSSKITVNQTTINNTFTEKTEQPLVLEAQQ